MSHFDPNSIKLVYVLEVRGGNSQRSARDLDVTACGDEQSSS